MRAAPDRFSPGVSSKLALDGTHPCRARRLEGDPRRCATLLSFSTAIRIVSDPEPWRRDISLESWPTIPRSSTSSRSAATSGYERVPVPINGGVVEAHTCGRVGSGGDFPDSRSRRNVVPCTRSRSWNAFSPEVSASGLPIRLRGTKAEPGSCRKGELDAETKFVSIIARAGIARASATKALLWTCTLAFLFAGASLARAENVANRQVEFHIPAQSLTTALLAFADQTGLQVMTSGASLPPLETSEVTGRQTIRSAMQTLLSGTQLSLKTVGDTTVTLISNGASRDAAEPARTDRETPGAPLRLAQATPAAGPPAATASIAEPENELQTVTVSASAITISGYEQPTPVQTIGVEQLQSAAKLDVTDALRSMPAFAGSTSPQNTVNSDSISAGVAALNQVDLRALGVNRTLVLIDGQRVVYGSLYGGVDTSNIPTALISRVDVVTGGASAIWGSDAWRASSTMS